MADERGTPTLQPTLSQTVGPFFHLGLEWLFSAQVAEPGAPGRHITVQGRVLDGDGVPVPDALIEIWQADANGDYPQLADRRDERTTPSFKGYARVPTDDAGAFRFSTVKPGRVPAPGAGMQAPHISVHVFMRGLLLPLATRIYFADEVANADDLVLGRVPASRRGSLIANARPGEDDVFEWNVVLQGADETVFFDG
ncbi:protocatechuate 3,4-dioxygenase subunit alpha [Sorangium sp. So ce726]|uniref:protocatechuate 3,4-dioxygenase subunit alpha n=1 Tax=Sorangium sp. So ce726 TaxID=3133319 RepID=UPI003F60D7E0